MCSSRQIGSDCNFCEDSLLNIVIFCIEARLLMFFSVEILISVLHLLALFGFLSNANRINVCACV